MANRFYIPLRNIDLKQNDAVLEGEEWRHASKVLRLKLGDELEFFDGQGNLFHSVILSSKNKIFSLKIKQTFHHKKDYSLSIFVGLPKGSKTDLIVKALTEEGATSIGFYSSKYSEARAKSAQKIERLKKISIEACKQSRRTWLPTLDVNFSFGDMLDRVQEAQSSVVFYEQATDFLPVPSFESKELAIVIGPEGGLSEDEIAKLRSKGAAVGQLNDAVLRVETAAIAAASLARYGQLV